MPPNTLTNFKIQNYYQNEPSFNGVCAKDNLPNKINDLVLVIKLDEYFDTVTNWLALYALNSNATYFDSFGIEHIPKEIKKIIDPSTVIRNIFKIHAYDSIMYGYV